jgi:hypothetical protein
LRLRREWRTTVAEGVTGAEDRSSFRHLPLRGIEYGVLPLSLEEDRKLIARVLAAKRSGLAAVPFWGRGLALASAATGTTVVLADEEAWEGSPDDYVFFSDQDPDSCEVGQVQTVSGATLTLKSALAGSYRGFCWPLIFGLFRCESLSVLTSHYGSLRIAVLERDVRPELTEDLCAIILLVDGGGDSFDCYPVQDPVEQPLTAGNYWVGPWHGATNFSGVQAQEPFEGYALGAPSTLGRGTGWAGSGVLLGNRAGRFAHEPFDYDDVSGLDEGSGWTGPGHLAVNP